MSQAVLILIVINVLFTIKGFGQNALKTIFRSKTLTFQNSSNVLAKTNVFEVRKVILGAQNRPEEIPRKDPKSLRRSLNNKRREEGQQNDKKEAT